MIKTFKSRKDILFTSLVFGVVFIMFSLSIFDFLTSGIKLESTILLIVNIAIAILLFWVLYGTKYELTSNKLKYFCGPLKGTILLSDIKEIAKNKTLWIGYKPATARKGLVIKYKKFDQIYISPASNETFIKEILKFKANIKIM